MKKSIYSLMLFDEIVEQIDKIAYIKGTNRSQLINDMLAQAIGLETPEQRVQKILNRVGDNLNGSLSVNQGSNSIQLGRSLKYKYRPKVVYSYEFVTDPVSRHAVLKVSSRSRSENLNEHFDQFFDKICRIEAKNDREKAITNDRVTNHKFVRELPRVGSINREVEAVSDFLTDYLRLIDSAMTLYFDSNGSKDVDREIEAMYARFRDAYPEDGDDE